MKIFQSLALAGSLAAAGTNATPLTIKPLIVGGTEVPVGDKTWMAGIRDLPYTLSRCGGSLITPIHVLTAGHCAKRNFVSVGTHFRTNNTDGEQIQIVSELIHPKYNLPDDNAASYDYKIFTLARPASYTPVRLLAQDATLYVGAVATAIGWGNTRENNGTGGLASNLLLRVDLPVLSMDQCASMGMAPLDESMVCAGGVEGEGTCNGDSGGPLFLETAQGDALMGVVSWGNGCARKDQPGVYARVSTVLEWIQENAPGVQLLQLDPGVPGQAPSC